MIDSLHEAHPQRLDVIGARKSIHAAQTFGPPAKVRRTVLLPDALAITHVPRTIILIQMLTPNGPNSRGESASETGRILIGSCTNLEIPMPNPRDYSRDQPGGPPACRSSSSKSPNANRNCTIWRSLSSIERNSTPTTALTSYFRTGGAAVMVIKCWRDSRN
jgi:hypothetical protein